MRLAGVGTEGQVRLGRARVLVVGCGALGTVVCEQLVRAGAGTVTIVDRDVVERSNLQRQTLFTERDAERRVPKAEAAKSRLAALNGSVTVRAFVDDLHGGNALRHASECDIVVDCLDNFESRYVLNDCAVMLGIPLVYGGAVGMRGMAAALLPSGCDARDRLVRWSDDRATPCLRCLAPEPPLPGEIETCESAGVLASAVGVAASIEAGLAIRLIAEGAARVPANIVRFDLATLEFHHASILGARDAACPCCVERRFEFVGEPTPGGSPDRTGRARVLCGRGAVEVQLGRALDARALERLSNRLAELGTLARERHGQTEVLRIVVPAGGTSGESGSVAARNALEPRDSAGTCGPAGSIDATAGLATPRQSRVGFDGQASALVVLAGVYGTLAIVEGTEDPEIARGVVARCLGV